MPTLDTLPREVLEYICAYVLSPSPIESLVDRYVETYFDHGLVQLALVGGLITDVAAHAPKWPSTLASAGLLYHPQFMNLQAPDLARAYLDQLLFNASVRPRLQAIPRVGNREPSLRALRDGLDRNKLRCSLYMLMYCPNLDAFSRHMAEMQLISLDLEDSMAAVRAAAADGDANGLPLAEAVIRCSFLHVGSRAVAGVDPWLAPANPLATLDKSHFREFLQDCLIQMPIGMNHVCWEFFQVLRCTNPYQEAIGCAILSYYFSALLPAGTKVEMLVRGRSAYYTRVTMGKLRQYIAYDGYVRMLKRTEVKELGLNRADVETVTARLMAHVFISKFFRARVERYFKDGFPDEYPCVVDGKKISDSEGLLCSMLLAALVPCAMGADTVDMFYGRLLDEQNDLDFPEEVDEEDSDNDDDYGDYDGDDDEQENEEHNEEHNEEQDGEQHEEQDKKQKKLKEAAYFRPDFDYQRMSVKADGDWHQDTSRQIATFCASTVAARMLCYMPHVYDALYDMLEDHDILDANRANLLQFYQMTPSALEKTTVNANGQFELGRVIRSKSKCGIVLRNNLFHGSPCPWFMDARQFDRLMHEAGLDRPPPIGLRLRPQWPWLLVLYLYADYVGGPMRFVYMDITSGYDADLFINLRLDRNPPWPSVDGAFYFEINPDSEGKMVNVLV